MKKSWCGAILLCVLLAACSGAVAEKPKPVAEAKPSLRLTLLPQNAVTQGKPVTVLAKLTTIEQRKIITNDQLQLSHTQKFHLLAVDSTLTDYQHIHPQPTAIPGIYSFAFTPKLHGGYRLWADVTPLATGKQEYVLADLGHPKLAVIDKAERHEATVNGYRFNLSFDKAPVMGGESMGMITVTAPDGSPVKDLQPVMGAYAHIVGFYDDFRNVVHIHPMGEEPAGAASRGSSPVEFHLMATRAGFIKLFAQIKINGNEMMVPFGVNAGVAQ
jgi:hypothetical protein